MTEQPPAGDQPVEPGQPLRVKRQSVRTVTRQPGPITTTTLLGNAPEIRPPVEQKSEKPKRSKLGWPIRDTLIKACKQIALDDGLHDYEVLEAFIQEGIERRNQQNDQKKEI